jgi:pimeloyl-ACP methyl ester carboxylesterase
MTEHIVGVAAGVPFIAVPPATARESAPVVVAWHLMDPPRTEAAFAAALPLTGLDAWRIYLGLPMCGSRTTAGGMDELMRLGYEDAVLNLQDPIHSQGAAEFAPAFDELRDRLGLGAGPVGLLGGSSGSAVAQLVLTEGKLDAKAAVLVSPIVQLRAAVEAMAKRYGITYPWSERSDAVARRQDFIARSGELPPDLPVLLVVGEDDDVAGFREPAERLRSTLGARAELAIIPGMGHELAEEPGIEPAPQTPGAAATDRLAVDWLRRHLTP